MTLAVVALPARSVALTAKVLVPAVDVLMPAPLATVPVQPAGPDNASLHT